MISLFEIQQMVSQYIRSAELLPLIRQRIQQTIEDICAANPPGKDWSFLKASFAITRDTTLSTSTKLVFRAPSNMRAMTEVVSLGAVPFAELIESPHAYNIEWTGREMTITRAPDSEAFPSGDLILVGYQAHPSVLVTDQQHQSPTWSTAWSASYPPASAVLLPDEAKSVIYNGTMLKLKGYENEVAFSYQEAQAEYDKGLQFLRDNYALQVYPLNPPATPDVGWLIAVGTNEVGTERFKDKIVAAINEIADELAEAVKIPYADIPASIKETSSALPTIKSVAVPAEYWLAGMRFKARFLAGALDQQTADRWAEAKREWADVFNNHHYNPSPSSTLTVAWLAAVGEKVLGGERYANQVLAFINEVAGELADIACLPVASRPAAIPTIGSTALPTIGNVSVAAEYWSAGVTYKCAAYSKTLDQPVVDRWEKAKSDWQSNYLTTSFSQNAPSPATVDWLLHVGLNIVGGKRFESQILEYINEVAGELADEVKTQINNRPSPVLSSGSTALPTIGGVAVPPLYWASGMVYKASALVGKTNQTQLDLWERSKREWHSNFNENVFEVNPPSTPTVQWLVKVGNNAVGGDRYQSRVLAFVNEIAGEFADVAKVPLVDRPAVITTVSSATLPAINGIAIPAEYWAVGMRVKCGIIIGTTTPQDEKQWEITKQEWASNYYTIHVTQTNFSLATFGGLVKYIQTEWKSLRDDHQAWTIANEIVADIMSRVNTDNLIASKSYTTVENQKEYTLPTDLKTVIKVEINDLEVPGRSFTSRGPTTPNMNEYQWLHFPSQQAFRLVGANLVLDRPPAPGATLVVWYYKSHVWTTTPSATVPVEPLLVIKAVQARVAIEEGNGSKASYYQNEFEKAIVQYNNNQYRNYQADDRVINATPSVNRRILRAFD